MNADQTPATDSEADLRARIASVQRADAEFRDDVRRAILRQYHDGTWCLPGSQDALRDLGLPPIRMSFTGYATIEVRINAVHGATDRADATDRVIAALTAACDDDAIDIDTGHVSASLEGNVAPEP